MCGMVKNSVVAGDYKGRGIVCGAKGPFINLKGSKTIFLNKQNIKRYEPVNKESVKDESSSLSLEILGAELLSSICALSESSQKVDEFLLAVEFIDETKCVINIDSRTYRCFVNAMLEEIPSKSGSVPQKKSHTLTIALIIAGVAIVLGLWSMIPSDNSGTSANTEVNETEVANTSENAWLAFDEKTWPEFVNLYTAHNNLMNAMDDFSNGNISSADFYQYCEKSKEYFSSMSLAFDFGESDEEKAYLSAFESMALSDQMAAESLMKYLDSWKTSDLSNAQENIQNAVTAATTIASNRGALLAKAGLSQEEIQVKIEEDMSDLG